MAALIIDLNILDEEILARAILHPPHFDNKKILVNRRLFLPPKNKTDVSLYRCRYASSERCKEAAKRLERQGVVYWGLAFFAHANVLQLNQQAQFQVEAFVVASPMDGNGQYIENRPVLEDEQGLPFHADLRYSLPYEPDEPNTPHRKYADALLEVAECFQEQ